MSSIVISRNVTECTQQFSSTIIIIQQTLNAIMPPTATASLSDRPKQKLASKEVAPPSKCSKRSLDAKETQMLVSNCYCYGYYYRLRIDRACPPKSSTSPNAAKEVQCSEVSRCQELRRRKIHYMTLPKVTTHDNHIFQKYLKF